MSAIKLSSRYAKSLLDLARERGELTTVTKDIRFIKSLIDSSHDLRLLLKSPIINPDKKLKILQAVFAGRISEMVATFIQILVRKGREPYLIEMTESYIHLYNQDQNITPIKITTAYPLDSKLMDELVSKIKTQTGIKNAELTTKVDESIIGGFVLQYDDNLLDASLVKGINALKKEFSNKAFEKQV